MDPQRLQATIAAAQGGAPEAYQALLEAYSPRLYGYFLRAVRDHHTAEDLLGELALKLVSRLGSYDDRGRFEPWLFRIAANMVRDRLRRLKVRPHVVSLSSDGSGRPGLGAQLKGPSRPADAPMLAAEKVEALNQALEKLDETSRQMILLRHFSAMSFKEIAEVYDCPIGTVLARVHRGLKSLRNIMSE